MRASTLVLLALVLAGCGGSSSSTTKGSGHVVTATRSVQSFTAVDLMGAATVNVAVGKPTALTISGDDNIVPLIHTDVHDGVLEISSKHGYSSKNALRLELATPSLDGLTLLGAGSFTAAGIHSKSFALDLSGAARLDLAGTTGTLDAKVSGVGAARLEQLVARDVHVSLSGTGSLSVHATESLDATVSGVGSISYTGSPKHVAKHVTGLGTISGA